MIRSTRAIQPLLRSRLTATQRGLHVSRVSRQSAGSTPNPETQRNNQYIMYGAGALGLGAIVYYMTTPKDAPKPAEKP